MRSLALGLLALLAACGGGNSTGPTSTSVDVPTTTSTVADRGSVQFVGDERPARLVIPPTWDPTGQPMPLVVLLHGYSATGELQDVYLGVSATGGELGYLTLAPDGTEDPLGNQFWNITTFDEAVDDAAYLIRLIDEVIGDYNADPDRVYLVGHSNGGFMANKLACEMPDRIAGIAAIAGGIVDGQSECRQPMRVAFIQGTEDGTVPYEGGALLGVEVLGAEETVARWRDAGSCVSTAEPSGPFDLDLLVPGDETTITSWDCEAGVWVDLWRMEGSGHVPGFRRSFLGQVMERLLGSEGQT